MNENQHNSRRITRLTALMAAHGFTFLQVYSFYMDIAHAYRFAHLRQQVVIFGAAMLVGVGTAYAALMIADNKQPLLRRGLEAASAGLLLLTWFVLGNTFLNLH